jgi:hypothetical protein
MEPDMVRLPECILVCGPAFDGVKRIVPASIVLVQDDKI